ncbi:diacylglycerol kinase family protein [Novosphingobium sp.]|uniref:diacylglycerol/lipid kinase family protein n=1 Tax=Novosphingobium sp. TaxID=1874826 RepID=UPI0027344A0B|nr:diacylglycerol kinase family protein [Novosphingobium sp.]MDP3907519.1 diacylglycerol kinase family protein [Novosphingobium sp.]
MRIALAYNADMAPRRLARIAALVRVLEARGHVVSHHDSLIFVAARDCPEAGLLCIAGGDGSARLVIGNQGDLAALPPVAIFPVGTINLLARELGYPANPLQFALRIEAGRPPLHSPLVRLNGAPVLACASVGIDAHTVAALSEDLKARIGRLAYVAALGSLLWRWPRTPLRIVADGQAFSAEAAFVLRGRFYAGPWMLDPAAHIAHPRLRLLALPRCRRRDLIALGFYAATGSHRAHPSWRVVECDALEITSAGPVPVQADGDAAGHLPARMTLDRASVRYV